METNNKAVKGCRVPEDPLKSMDENVESKEENDLSNFLIKRLEPRNLPVLGMKYSCPAEFDNQMMFVHDVLDKKLPRNIITFDERYLIRCLELIHDHASRVSTCNLSSTLSHNLNSQANMFGFSRGEENIVLNSTGEGILGAITCSRSMTNILNSPLLVKSNTLDSDVNELLCSGLMSSIAPPRLQRERVIELISTPSSISNSTCSDCSPSSNISRGMLEIAWRNGSPRCVFSRDDKEEVYVADLLEFDSTEDAFLNYVYLFHSRLREGNVGDAGPNVVGRMTVSSSSTVSLSKSQILESRFVLYGSGDTQTESHTNQKNKRLAKKVVNAFRTVHSNHSSNKQRSSNKSSQDLGVVSEAESRFLPNLELAAIVVKEEINNTHKKAETGGWGMKFLKKPKRNSSSLDTSSHSEHASECSTSLDVLVPTGFHGGPRTRNGGPSSLLERWSSGGHCDCGGWDIGCPMMTLKTRPNKIEPFSETGASEDCKSIDLFIQGSKQSKPILKMSNIHDGLYYIHSQSTLSPLQSFAISIAIIHSRNPILRSKVYKR